MSSELSVLYLAVNNSKQIFYIKGIKRKNHAASGCEIIYHTEMSHFSPAYLEIKIMNHEFLPNLQSISRYLIL